MASGTPIIIHPKKETACPISPRTLAATAFGGVPIIVPIPPIFAANGTASTRAFLNGSRPSKCWNRGVRSTIIIAVVAVLDMNIENKPVIIITPRRTILGCVPNGLRKAFANRTSKPCLAAAMAMSLPISTPRALRRRARAPARQSGLGISDSCDQRLLYQGPRDHLASPGDIWTGR